MAGFLTIAENMEGGGGRGEGGGVSGLEWGTSKLNGEEEERLSQHMGGA